MTSMRSAHAEQIEKSTRFITDPVITEYVNRIAQNLAKNSDAKIPFSVKIVDSDEINAFALPGGFFFVNSGLILAADEESELAGVLAHEMSHVIMIRLPIPGQHSRHARETKKHAARNASIRESKMVSCGTVKSWRVLDQ